MDPITAAIVAALSAGVASGVTDVGKKVIVDAYDALKTVIKNKYGRDSALVKAVTDIEKKSTDARRAVLQEEVEASQADQDPEVLKAAQALLDLIEAEPGGEQFIQTATGSYIAQAGQGSKATVKVNQPKE